MRFVLRKQFNSLGEAGVTVGTTADGGAAAGTGVATIGGAAWAGVVRPAGMDGDGQATARWLAHPPFGLQLLVHRLQVGQECSDHDHSLTEFLTEDRGQKSPFK